MSSRRRGQPKRRSRARTTRSVYVFTEGEKTEPQYFTHWSRLYRRLTRVTLDSRTGRDPRTLVELARDTKKKHLREQKNGEGTAYDQYWCVFDRDDHQRWMDALQMALDNGIEVAVSNPCIELWFLLHFRSQEAWIKGRDVQSLVKLHLSGSKSLEPRDFELLRDGYDTARSRAIALDAKHEREGHPSGWNPSSGVWRLVDYVSGGGS